MAVPEVHRRVGGEAVEVASPLDVGDPGALRGRDDDGQRVVVVRERRVFDRDGGGRRGLGPHRVDTDARDLTRHG